MQKRAQFLFAAAATLAALLAPSPALASPITIENPSFEALSRPLALGEQTNGAGGAAVPVATRFPFAGGGVSWGDPIMVPGWRTRLLPFGSPNTILAGVLNPPLLSGQPFMTGHDGDNVTAVQAAQMGQALGTQLAPNTHYHLDFLGGIGRFGSQYVLTVSLIAVDTLDTLPIENEPGVTRLAITQGLIPPTSTFGTMLPYSLDYTTPLVLPSQLEGKYIGIHMWGSDGIPRVVYDNFRLEATTLPEPATAALFAIALGAGLVRRKRRVQGRSQLRCTVMGGMGKSGICRGGRPFACPC